MSDEFPNFTLDPNDINDMFFNFEFDEMEHDKTAKQQGTTQSTESRFGLVNQEEINHFLIDQENQNTKRKTISDMKLFKQFCKEQHEEREPEFLTYQELDHLYGNYISIVKKPSKEEYEPSSIRGFVSSLERHLRQKGYTQNVNKNPNFPHSNNAIKAKMAFLKSQGLGSKPNESDELTDADIEKLFESSQLGIDTPIQIVNLLHMTFSLSMGMRGGREQHQLKWGDIELCTDSEGDQYLKLSRERQTKTRTGADHKNVRKFKPKAFNNKDDPRRCPVKAYERMRLNRPETMKEEDSPFFLSINHAYGKKPGALMFKNCPMGINHIYGLVKSMKNGSDIQGRKLTNHSVRKHLLQKCNDLGLPPNQTIQISGHKNIGSVNNYSKMNENQHKQAAMALVKQTDQRALVKTNPIQPNQSSSTVSSVGLQFSQDNSTSSHSRNQMDVEAMFHGTTVIHGGTFNFYQSNAAQNEYSRNTPRPKRRRILPVDSDSE